MAVHFQNLSDLQDPHLMKSALKVKRRAHDRGLDMVFPPPKGGGIVTIRYPMAFGG